MFRPLLADTPAGVRRFRPLGGAAAAAEPQAQAAPAEAARVETVLDDMPPPPPPPQPELPPEVRAALDGALREYAGELRRAVAQARESLERGARDVLATLARDVLVRELALAPADLDAVVAGALDDYAAARPLALRVAPGSPLADGTLPVRYDPGLERGDLVVETADGEIDLRIATRLTALVRNAGPR